MNILKRYTTWNWERVQRHMFYWLTWSIFFVMVNNSAGKIVSCDGKEVELWQWISFECVVLPIKLISTYTLAYVIMPQFLYRKKFMSFVLYSICLVLLFSFILYLTYAKVVYPIILGETTFNSMEIFVYQGVELLYISSIVIGIKFFQNFLHQQNLNQDLIQKKTEAELKYLKNQIQPHFLFNTLNNIYGMVLSKNDNAATTLVNLSNLMSYTLYECNTDKVSLSKEIEMLDVFIEIEMLRYERKVNLKYTKAKIPEDLSIAPLLLIPFVENAFKHGAGKQEEITNMEIKVELQNNIFHFMVSNSYQDIANQNDNLNSGIGLENIKKRLELIYPDQHTLSITREDVFTVSLIIDLTNE